MDYALGRPLRSSMDYYLPLWPLFYTHRNAC
jgi:hypothetical protein